MSDTMTTTPMMIGMPAVVTSTRSFLIGPGADTKQHVSFGAGMVPGHGPAIFVGLYTEDGQMMSGVFPADQLADFKELIAEAERYIAMGCPMPGAA